MSVQKGMIYEVKKRAVTVEWTDRLPMAQAAFGKCEPGGVVMYALDRATGKKWEIQRGPN